MRIFAVSALLGPGLMILTASCAWPPPELAMAPPSPAAATTAPVTAPGPMALAPSLAPPPVVAAEPSAPAVAAAGPPPPARSIDYVPLPFLWSRMLAQPAPAGRLILNNFSFEPTRVQTVLVSGTPCAFGDPSTATEFVLPSNGTRVIPAPPGIDICWRRQLIAGETREIPPTGPWTAWSRVYTASGRFLDVVVVTPPPLATVAATVENAPPPTVAATSPTFPPLEK